MKMGPGPCEKIKMRRMSEAAARDRYRELLAVLDFFRDCDHTFRAISVI